MILQFEQLGFEFQMDTKTAETLTVFSLNSNIQKE